MPKFRYAKPAPIKWYGYFPAAILRRKYSGGFTFHCRYGPCGSTQPENLVKLGHDPVDIQIFVLAEIVKKQMKKNETHAEHIARRLLSAAGWGKLALGDYLKVGNRNNASANESALFHFRKKCQTKPYDAS